MCSALLEMAVFLPSLSNYTFWETGICTILPFICIIRATLAFMSLRLISCKVWVSAHWLFSQARLSLEGSKDVAIPPSGLLHTLEKTRLAFHPAQTVVRDISQPRHPFWRLECAYIRAKSTDLLEAEYVFAFTGELTLEKQALQLTCGSGFQSRFVIFHIWQK